MKAILLDIEGTTVPIDFVHKILFPYARARIHDFVTENFAHLHEEIHALRGEYQRDVAGAASPPDFDERDAETVAEYLRFLIDSDRKSTPLKTIQGKIWRAAYESGAIKSEIFPDVAPAFDRWYEQGITIAIYSSGSVLAQKLIFKYSNRGDLTRYISEYFDTRVGGKKDAESYRRIASAIGFSPVEILFVSDIVEELDAARQADFQTLLAVRGENTTNEDNSYKIIRSFDGV